MRGFYSIDYLSEKPFGLFLLHIIVLNVIVQFSLICHLHDHEDVSSCIKHLIQFDDAGVVDKLQNADLPFDLVQRWSTLDIIFVFFIRALLMILTATLTPVKS